MNENCNIENCTNQLNTNYCLNVSSYFGCCPRSPFYFCSEYCMNEFDKKHRCQTCHRTSELKIADDGLAYCETRLYDDSYLTCYDLQPGTDKNKIKEFMELYMEKTKDLALDFSNFPSKDIKAL